MKITYIYYFIVFIQLLIIPMSCKTGPSDGAFLTVDPMRCFGCSSCVRICNADAIVMISEKAVIDLTKCIQCGKCINICPVDAIE